jgi:hypothetical protein
VRECERNAPRGARTKRAALTKDPGVHEARLCLSIIRLAEEVLEREGGRSILRLELEVGELSGVAAEALEAAFPICARGTRAEGAALDWRAAPGRGLLLRALEVT